MMKRSVLVLALGLMWVAAPSDAVARDKIGNELKLGVGLGGGTLTSGLTLKYYVAPHLAVQAIFGRHYSYGNSLGVDGIFDVAPLWQPQEGTLAFGLGAGVGIYLYDSVGRSESLIAVSAIGQLSFHFSAIPLELVLDIRPSFFVGDFVSGVSWTRGGGAIRYFF